MKALLLLALVAFSCSSKNTQELSISLADELIFSFLTGFGVTENYPNCEICKTATSEITDNFAQKIMGIYNNKGDLDKDGFIQASYALGIIPDFMRHCQGTAAYIISAISEFSNSFTDFQEFFDLLVENGTYVLSYVVMEFRKLGTLREEQNYTGMAESLGKIFQKIFDFEGTKKQLLLSPEPALLEASETQEDLFINMIRFGTGALKYSQIIPDDTEMKICGDSFINIDNLWTDGAKMVYEQPAEGVFTMADSLKELGPLVENCIDTYEDALNNSLDRMNKLPSQEQLALNLFGHLNLIVLHLVNTQIKVSENDYSQGGAHLGAAFSYLFKDFDPNSDASDGLP